MPCCADEGPSILDELKELVHQIGDACDSEPPCKSCQQPCCAPCYTPCNVPFAQVVMTCPPPILAPTRPEPVKPLQLPCPPCCGPPPLTPVELERSRFDNFYNNYNIDWHAESECVRNSRVKVEPKYAKDPGCCEDYTKTDDCCGGPGCPTGFKPCTMRLTPPPCCNPYGVWCAQVQPCPPKPKKKDNIYVPGPCMRPCCKHWEPKEGPCLYDDPCKAHCYNHPPGMKPSGRWP